MDTEVRQRNGGTGKESSKSAPKDHDSVSSKTDASSQGSGTDVGMRRNIGLLGGISFVVGGMIGSGIFVSPKGVLEGSGSVGLALIIWVVGGLLALCGALTYAELGTLIPKSGGEHAYLMESMHPVFTFLFDYVSILLLKPSGAAILGLTCSEYLLVPFFNDGCGSPPELINKLLAITVLFLLAAINVISAKTANQVQIFFTIAKLAALVIIILGGIVKLGQGYTENLQEPFKNTNDNIGEVALAFYSSMWAYDGWNTLNILTEEVKSPHKTLPRALILGIPLVIVVYFFTNLSYFTVLTVDEILDSPAVAISWAERVIPNFTWTMPIFVAMSTFGAANGSLFSSGRLAFVAGRDKHTLKILSQIHVRSFTPSVAIMFTAFLASCYIVPSNIGALIDLFSFVTWIFYGLVFGCCIYLRWKMPDAPRPYKVNLILPILAIIASIYLVLAPIIAAPSILFLYAFLFVLSGLLFYFPFVWFAKEIPGLSTMNAYLQLFFNVLPEEEEYLAKIIQEENPEYIADVILHSGDIGTDGVKIVHNKVHPIVLDVQPGTSGVTDQVSQEHQNNIYEKIEDANKHDKTIAGIEKENSQSRL